MKDTYRLLLFLTPFLILNCNIKNKNLNAEETQIDDYSAKIDSLIKTIKPRAFNGIILITKNGETKYSKAHGYSNYEDKTSISLNDNFRIQSNSKQITAALILKEVEKGNINLNYPIKEYLPDLSEKWVNEVTVHQLLNNSSGIMSIDQPLLFEAGTEFYYSNAGYGLLGRIIEKVTSKEYIEVANDLFDKLGMKNSYCYELDKENDSSLVNGYKVTNNNFNFVDINTIVPSKEWWKDFIPAGGIISNAYDLNIWDKKLHSGDLLSSETYALMTDFKKTTDFFKVFGNEKVGYGYGVCISNEPLEHIGHAGKGIGFCSFKFYLPEKKLDVIVLENVYSDNPDIFFHFESKIRDIVLESSLLE